MQSTTTQGNRLVADLGGTNTRLALYDPFTNELRARSNYINRDYASPDGIIADWLQSLDERAPTDCCLAVAAPPSGDRVTMLNINWSFSCQQFAEQFGFTRLCRLNDFEANAYALPHLANEDLITLHAGAVEVTTGTLATVGPGTGLGGSTLTLLDGIPTAHACEPGSTGLAAATELELALFSLLQADYGEVYAELILSGPGLQRLYQTMAKLKGMAPEDLTSAQVSTRALSGQCELCVTTLNTFCDLLGSICGDFLLANGAYGGLYLAGGILPRMIPFLKASHFKQRLQAKGLMRDKLEAVPVYVITYDAPGLLGAAHAPF